MRNLDERELRIIQECLFAAVRGPFFPDWEFATLFGLSRGQVARVADRWPESALNDEIALAVNNTLVNLTGYPHGEEDSWDHYISAPRSSVKELLQKWNRLAGQDDES